VVEFGIVVVNVDVDVVFDVVFNVDVTLVKVVVFVVVV
jgi:hypothetical protein